jgi:capsular exopolysaccharide synthesis family protein
LKNSSEINPVVINLDEQINNLKRSLRTGLSNIESSNLIKLEALNKEDARISSKIYSAPKKERQFRDLNRQQNIKESLYLYLLQKREEAAIANGIATPNAIVVNEAYPSGLPVSPKRKFIYIAALIFGILIPTFFIFIYDLLDIKIHTKNDLINLTTIPYLGGIPKSKSKNSIIQKVDYSPIAEAFRLVRTNIDFMLSGLSKNEGKVIFVTSTTSQEGKSHTSINLAKSLSFSGKKVLIIESDIRVPKANKYLKVKNKTGLTDYLVNNKLTLAETVSKIDENLYILPSGTIPPNPAELLMSDKINSLFENVKKDYDYIIVDTSAIGLVTDTLVIGKHADLFVYVVRANYLDKRQLSIAQTAYDEKRLPKMTILLNGVTSKKGYGYGYGYGSNPKAKKKWYNFYSKKV